MGIAYRNIWSLSVDEAVVVGIIRNVLCKHKRIEVFMPMNAQLKDIDLIVINLKNKKVTTIQVKGSKAHQPKSNEVKKRKGGSGWFFFKKNTITKATADYFIFLVYVFEELSGKRRKSLEPHLITIPTEGLKKLCRQHHKIHGKSLNFYFWINPNEGKAEEWRDEPYSVSKYLDERGIKSLLKYINA